MTEREWRGGLGRNRGRRQCGEKILDLGSNVLGLQIYQGGGGQVVGCIIGPRRDVEAPGKMRAVKRKVK